MLLGGEVNLPAAPADSIDSVAQASPSVLPSAYTVHEWGTFTSVFGSDGVMLPGLEVEEERLPPFVYAHDGMSGRTQIAREVNGVAQAPPGLIIMTKGYRRPLHDVTVKMETPVLYFYSREKIEARVRVGFKGGSISQWYPARSGGEIPPRIKMVDGVSTLGAIDFGVESYQGGIEWEFTVEERDVNSDFEVMKPHETSTWIHPRAPRSNVLTTASGDSETYLFYRGVGNIVLPLTFKVTEDEKLTIEADAVIPYLLIVEILHGKLRIISEGSVVDGFSVDLADATETLPMSEMRLGVYVRLKAALIEAGLFEDEAAAMLRTWWNSYFGRDGLRAFWIVPRGFTDKILPLHLDPAPAPKNLERVLLGRSEILTPRFEQKLKKTFKKAVDEKGRAYNPFGGDRYAKAYQARVKALGLELR